MKQYQEAKGKYASSMNSLKHYINNNKNNHSFYGNKTLNANSRKSSQVLKNVSCI